MSDKLKMHDKELYNENFEKLTALFSSAVSETKDKHGNLVRVIDKDKLEQEINGTVLDGREECYQCTWCNKKKAMLEANALINATLRPCRDESVDFGITQNLYIEGDNLDVLKLLRETYLNKIKMIYIDIILSAVAQGKIVGYQGIKSDRPIYEVSYLGETYTIAITVGSNGYIVGVNPKRRK